MRLLFIICESGVENRVVEILDRLKAPGYTRFQGATGYGRHGRREGSPIWPGLNSLILTCVPEEMIDDLLVCLDKLSSDRNGRLALQVFSVAAEQHPVGAIYPNDAT